MTDPAKLARDIQAGTAHASAADIQEILRLRRQTPVATPEELQAERMRKAGREAPHPSEIVKSLAVQQATSDQPTQTPPLVPAPTPTDDATIAEWLGEALPRLAQKTAAIFTREAEGGLPEAWRDLMALVQEVSTDVAVGLPMLKGAEAKGLVTAVVLFLFNRYAAPAIGPMPSLLIRGVLPLVVQFVYDKFVAPALGKLHKIG